MKTTLIEIKNKAEELFGSLETGNLYNISSLGLKVHTPTGFSSIRGFIVKEGRGLKIQFSDGLEIKCLSSHQFETPSGTKFASELEIGDLVSSESGSVKVVSAESTEETEFYDVEVDSDAHVFYSANGILHHNTGKTFTTEAVLKEFGWTDGHGYTKVAGSASASGIYRILFKNRNDVVLFDDADSALTDGQEGRNIFKAAADTKKVRKISWLKSGGQFVDEDDYDEDAEGDDGRLPRSFEYKGRIIFISNLPLQKLDPDGALRTRAIVLDIDPTNEEIFEFLKKIVDHIELDINYDLPAQKRQEVVDVIKTKKLPEKTANLRMIVRGLNMAAGILMGGGSDSEWKVFVKRYA